MGFTTVPTVATNDPWTAAQHNQFIRDNFAAVRPDTGIARRAANQSIANASEAALSLDTEDDDTASFFDIAGNPTRLTYPYTGIFLVVAEVAWAANTTGDRGIELERNGGGVADKTDYRGAYQRSGVATSQNITLIAPRSASDYHELFCFQDSTAALNVTGKISVATLRDDS